MTALIVGCGYLGRRVARLLIERGETVFATTRSEGRASELAALGVRPMIADVLLPETLEALPEVARVLHCVGFDRDSGHSRQALYVEGLRNVLKALKGRPKIVLASTTSVYGRGDGLMDEHSPATPDTESGRVCLEAERLLDAQGVIVRYSGLYGPGRVIRREAISRGEPILGDPDAFLNLIHIDDAAEAAVCALDRGVSGRIYLATDDQPVTRGELYRLTARLLGAPEPVFIADEAKTRRRFSNRRIKDELGLALRYPSIATGLPAAIAGQSAGAGSM